jgi:hypothetical protein
MHHCVLYTAKTYRPFDRATLAQILGVARVRNEMAGLTGLLLYGRSTVMQYLEGSQAAVENTLERIRRDTRVYDVRVEVSRATPMRLFPDWSMAYDHARCDPLAETTDLRSPDALPEPGQRFNLALTMLRNFRDGVVLLDTQPPAAGRPAARQAVS